MDNLWQSAWRHGFWRPISGKEEEKLFRMVYYKLYSKFNRKQANGTGQAVLKFHPPLNLRHVQFLPLILGLLQRWSEVLRLYVLVGFPQ